MATVQQSSSSSSPSSSSAAAIASVSTLSSLFTVSISPSAILSSLTDPLKPHKAEAALRLRHATVGLLALFLITNLIPLPNLYTAWRTVRDQSIHPSGLLWWVCAAELTLFCLLSLSILQSLYAIKYPRTEPNRSHPSALAGSTRSPPRRKLEGITTHVRSPPVRPFSASFYASTPPSTPSRTLRYAVPLSPSPAGSTSSRFSISRGSISSPSPAGPGWRIKGRASRTGRVSNSLGRPLDGSWLGRLALEENDYDPFEEKSTTATT